MVSIFSRGIDLLQLTLPLRKGKELTHDSRYASRSCKSEKVLAVLHDFLGVDLSTYTCLDIGCSQGGITHQITPHFRWTIGIDPDQGAIQDAVRSSHSENIGFAIASGYLLPFPEHSFDVVICAQVYEHVLDQPGLAREIWRVLRPGAICFFSGPNRLAFMEEHYWLPLLSWPPRPLSNLYMRLFQRGNFYDAYPLFYWQIRDLWRSFIINDYTLTLIHEPHRFATGSRLGKFAWVSRLPTWLLRMFTPLYPNYNWILVKPS